MGTVDKCHESIASGINKAVLRIAGLLAIAVLGIVVLSAFTINLDSHLAALRVSPQV